MILLLLVVSSSRTEACMEEEDADNNKSKPDEVDATSLPFDDSMILLSIISLATS